MEQVSGERYSRELVVFEVACFCLYPGVYISDIHIRISEAEVGLSDRLSLKEIQ